MRRRVVETADFPQTESEFARKGRRTKVEGGNRFSSFVLRPSSFVVLVLFLLAIALHAGWPSSAAAQEPDAPAAANEEADDQEADSRQPIADSPSPTTDGAQNEVTAWQEEVVWPLVILGIGVATVLGLIIVMKVNAFIALIAAAMLVSLLAPGAWGEKISRVAAAFGATAGGIGIVIALAAVIGKCMLDSGAADRIVRAFLRVLGEKQSPVALMGSGFVLAIPVFFDTVFYLLVPLARSLHRKTGKEYLKYILAIGAGGAITHTLVPPTPGPLLMAETLGIDVGWMIMFGLIAAFPAAVGGVMFASVADRIMQTPMRPIGNAPEPAPLKDEELPPLFWSLAPVVLPVLLISSSTILNLRADAERNALLRVEDIRDFPEWRRALREEAEAEVAAPGRRLLEHEVLSPRVRDLVGADRRLSEEERAEVIAAVNRILADKEFYDEQAFARSPMSDLAKELLGARGPRMRQGQAERMNRALLESAYPELIAPHEWDTPMRRAADVSNIFGDANFALLLSAVIAMGLLMIQRGLNRTQMAEVAETSLMSGGVIILITAGGGAFGAMLQVAQVGPAIQTLFGQSVSEASSGVASAGLSFLVLGFGIAAVLKIAQGSSTVAMIVGSAMIAAIVQDMQLEFHPVYLAVAIGAGSLVGSWMNDSGFWIFAKMGGLTEVEALKSWTVMLVFLGLISFGMSLIMATVLPMAP